MSYAASAGQGRNGPPGRQGGRPNHGMKRTGQHEQGNGNRTAACEGGRGGRGERDGARGGIPGGRAGRGPGRGRGRAGGRNLRARQQAAGGNGCDGCDNSSMRSGGRDGQKAGRQQQGQDMAARWRARQQWAEQGGVAGRMRNGPEGRRARRNLIGSQEAPATGGGGSSSNSDAGGATSDAYSMWGSRSSKTEQARKAAKGVQGGGDMARVYEQAHKNKYGKGRLGVVTSQSFSTGNGTDDAVPTVYGTAYAVLWQSREQLLSAPLINNRTRYSGELRASELPGGRHNCCERGSPVVGDAMRDVVGLKR